MKNLWKKLFDTVEKHPLLVAWVGIAILLVLFTDLLYIQGGDNGTKGIPYLLKTFFFGALIALLAAAFIMWLALVMLGTLGAIIVCAIFYCTGMIVGLWRQWRSLPVWNENTDWNDRIASLRKHVEQGDAEAQYALAKMFWMNNRYLMGMETMLTAGGKDFYVRHVASNMCKMMYWCRKAAEQGHAEAQYSLGLVAENGSATAKYHTRASWSRPTYAPVYGSGGGYNSAGIYVAVDERKLSAFCRKLRDDLRKATDSGRAMGHRIWTYTAAKDMSEAVYWYRKAAEQGYPPAQHSLAIAYQNGCGIAVDKHEAMRWHRRAADAGHAAAQNNLGYAYFHGEVVAADKREAYIWFLVALESGDENAAFNTLKMDGGEFLSETEIRSATKEALRRLSEINRRKAEHDLKF